MLPYILIAPLLWWLFHGLTWFAWPIIIMLLLSPFIPLPQLTPLVALLGVFLNLFLIIRHHKQLQWNIIKPLLLPSLLGIPFGYMLLQWVDSFRAKKVIAVSIFFFLGIHWWLQRKKWQFPARISPLLAWSAGMFWFAYNVNGPQLAARLITKNTDKDVSVLISTTYFFVFWSVFVLTHWISGWYTQALDRSQVAVMIGVLLAWSWCWDRLHQRMWNTTYHHLLVFFLLMSTVIFLL